MPTIWFSGTSTSIFFKLWTLAPRTWILSGLQFCPIILFILLPPFQGIMFCCPRLQALSSESILYHTAPTQESASANLQWNMAQEFNA